MALFYSPDIQDNYAFLSEEESHHCLKVLRYSVGSSIQVTDGKGAVFEAIIRDTKAKIVKAELIQQVKILSPKTYHIHIVLSPTKQIDRTEWFIEKSVEIGVQEITMLYCEHSERKHLKMERLEKIAISAMKQSGQVFLPKLHALTKFTDFMAQKPAQDQRFIAYVDENHNNFLAEALIRNKSYCILIGPEGDFSSKEIALALNNGFQAVSLGNQRYRTETAGIVACHMCNLIHEMNS